MLVKDTITNNGPIYIDAILPKRCMVPGVIFFPILGETGYFLSVPLFSRSSGQLSQRTFPWCVSRSMLTSASYHRKIIEWTIREHKGEVCFHDWEGKAKDQRGVWRISKETIRKILSNFEGTKQSVLITEMLVCKLEKENKSQFWLNIENSL